MLNKNRLRKCIILRDKQPQKKSKMATLDRAHQAKKSSVNLTMVGLNSNRGVYPTSSKFSEAKRFVWRLNKVQGKYIQEQQPN